MRHPYCIASCARHAMAAAVFTCTVAFAGAAWAVDVVLVGIFSTKALVQINGAAPRILSVGQAPVEGVTLVAVGRDNATLQIDGKRQTLAMGQGNHGAKGSSGSTVTLSADSRGHFSAEGLINGSPVRFVVDTGATLVSLSSSEAKRLALDYERGEPVAMNTANGTIQARRVRLNQVRLGAISVSNVDAVVVDNLAMPTLLGMSFLNRMDMRREGQLMTLTQRY
jgi:aspartyl protease family protein